MYIYIYVYLYVYRYICTYVYVCWCIYRCNPSMLIYFRIVFFNEWRGNEGRYTTPPYGSVFVGRGVWKWEGGRPLGRNSFLVSRVFECLLVQFSLSQRLLDTRYPRRRGHLFCSWFSCCRQLVFTRVCLYRSRLLRSGSLTCNTHTRTNMHTTRIHRKKHTCISLSLLSASFLIHLPCSLLLRSVLQPQPCV